MGLGVCVTSGIFLAWNFYHFYRQRLSLLRLPRVSIVGRKLLETICSISVNVQFTVWLIIFCRCLESIPEAKVQCTERALPYRKKLIKFEESSTLLIR